MRGLKYLLGMGILVVAAYVQAALATPLRYRVEGIGGPGANGIFSATALNNLGQVAGMNLLGSGVSVPFLYQDGHWSRPEAWRALNLFSIGALNDNGDLGGSFFKDRSFYPFVYRNGQFTDLNLGLGPGHGQVYSINQAGHAVGYMLTQQGGFRSYYYNGRKVQFYDNLSLSLVDINDHDVAVYSHGYILDRGNFEYVPALDDQHGENILWALNNAGQVVGRSIGRDGSSAAPFLYSNGVMSDLGSIGGRYGFALDINNKGWIVGEATTQEGDMDAFLYRDGAMRNLEDLLRPKDQGQWDFSGATKINERGQILATLRGSSPSDYRSALLTPVPEAQSWALLLAGLGVVGAVAGRRRKGASGASAN